MSVTLVLPIELTNGNEGRTKHWGDAKNRRRQYEAIIRLMHAKPTRIEPPVTLTITRVLGKGQRLYDADSLGRGNAKELIDSIVAVGFLADDGPKIITSVTYRQDASRRADGPSTEVIIESAHAPDGEGSTP